MSFRAPARSRASAARDTLPLPACIQPQVPPTGSRVTLFCDGACNTGRRTGGWATLLQVGDRELILSGNEHDTTNNRMELTALLRGLEALKRPCPVTVVTDSQYLRKAFTDGWILKWQRGGWLTASREPVKNRELWEALIEQAQRHALTFVWVRGHTGHGENERVDTLAVQERKKLE